MKDVTMENLQQTHLFTMDVKALYPSIPRKETLETCRKSLGIPSEAVMTMINTVLENNNFKFNGQNYIQTDGTAIGSKLDKT